MSRFSAIARDWFIATSFLATGTLLIGYGVANYNTAQYEAQYEFSAQPASGLHTSH